MRVLITAPLKQSRKIFAEYQEGLDRLFIPEGVTVDRFYVVNDCPEIIPDIRGEYIVVDTGDFYNNNGVGHYWTGDNLTKMHTLRNATIKRALDGGYDYWWSIDTDIVVHPMTLQALLDADKDIVSEIFWTQSENGGWWCNAWMHDQSAGMLPEWHTPGLYRCGMTGALTLAKRRVLEAGVDYTAIPCIRKALWGEDRHFSIRAACLGFEMWVDTHYPANHLYTEAVYRDYMRKKNA